MKQNRRPAVSSENLYFSSGAKAKLNPHGHHRKNNEKCGLPNKKKVPYKSDPDAINVVDETAGSYDVNSMSVVSSNYK